MRSTHHSERHWGILLHSNAVWIKKCQCNLSIRHEHNFSWLSTKNGGMLCWRHCSQESQQGNHLDDLRIVFNIIWTHQLKMNPTKIILGSVEWLVPWIHSYIQRNSSWPLQSWGNLGHVTPEDPLKELKGLQGRLAYIRRFIAICQPFTRLMKKGVSFVWDEAYQNAFEDIKEYLTKPPVLVAPVSGKHACSMYELWSTLWMLF